MAEYNFREKKDVQTGTFYYYNPDDRKDKVGEYGLIFSCDDDDDYRIQSLKLWSDYHFLRKNDKVFTTREEAEEYAAKKRAEKQKAAERRAEQKRKHDEMVDAYFAKKDRLKADDFVRMIKQRFEAQQTLTYIAKQLRPTPEPFEYYHRAFAMLRNGYVDYVVGNRDIRGRCYFKNVDYVEAKKTGKKDNKGADEYKVTLYKGKEEIFTTTCPDLTVPLRMIFTNYDYNNDWWNKGWKNKADKMNDLPDGNN